MQKEKNRVIAQIIFVCLMVFSSHAFEVGSGQDNFDSNAQKYFLYLKAGYQHLSGNVAGALNSYDRLFDKNVPVYAYDGLIRLLFDINQLEKIVELYNETKGAFTQNLEVQLIVAQALLSLNNDSEAENLFDELAEKYPDNEQVAYYTAVSFIKNNQNERALKFIDQVLKKPALKSKHFLFYFLKSKILMQMGRSQEALAVIKKSIELYPSFERGWLLKALLEEQLGRINEAVSGYQRFLDIVGHDLAVEKQLVHLLFSLQRFSEAADVLKRMDADSPEYYFDIALIEWKAGKGKTALQNVNKAIDKLPDFRKAKLLKVEILLAQNKNKEVLNFMQEWIQREPQDSSVVRILLLLRRGNVSRADIIQVLEGVAQVAEDSVGILSALADLYLEQQDYQSVLNYCQKVLDKTQDGALKSKVLFTVGYIHFIAKEKDKVEKALRNAIKHKPTYPSAYNLLAYHYAINEENLDDALKMIELALKAQPNTYYYLDTKGYILLKLGRTLEAVEAFEQALSLMPDDQTVKEHLEMARGQ
jgi:tetratricopeptide (TPR) repeat protein